MVTAKPTVWDAEAQSCILSIVEIQEKKTQNQKIFKTAYYQPIKDLSDLQILHS